MERLKLANGQKAEPVYIKSARAPQKQSGHRPKTEKLVCRYCGGDDLAPSFIIETLRVRVLTGSRNLQECTAKD